MNRVLFVVLLLNAVSGFAVQKILRPMSTCVYVEKIPETSTGITLDINIIDGQKVTISSGMKGKQMERAEMVGSYRRTLEPKSKGDFEVYIKNEEDRFINLSISVYVDKTQEDTDKTEMLRKLVEKLRIDLLNIYNDNLKLKNANTDSLLRIKAAKSSMWLICASPIVYIGLNYIRLNIIKGFFSNKKSKRI